VRRREEVNYPKARAFAGVGLLAILWLVLLAACQTDAQTSEDSDADRSEHLEAQNDPCQGAAVNCSPGQCRVVDGKAQCDCPQGYFAERYSCRRSEDGDLDDERLDEPGADEEDRISDQEDNAPEEEETPPAVVKTFSHLVSRDDPLLQQGEVRVTAPGKVADAPPYSYDVYGDNLVYCSESGDLYICNLEKNGDEGCYFYDIARSRTDCFFPSIYKSTVSALSFIKDSANDTASLLLLNFPELRVTFPLIEKHLNYYNIDNWDNIVVWDNDALGIQIFNTITNEIYVVERSQYWFNAFPRVYKQYVIWQFHYTNPPPLLNYILLHDLTTRDTIDLTEGDEGPYCYPATTDKRAVWIKDCVAYDNPNGKGILIAQDLTSSERTVIDPNDAEKTDPDIDEDRVVWADLRNGSRKIPQMTISNADIYLYDFTKNVTIQLTIDPSNQFWPRIRGRWAIFQDDRWGNDFEVTAFDLCTLDIYKDDPMCAAEKK